MYINMKIGYGCIKLDKVNNQVQDTSRHCMKYSTTKKHSSLMPILANESQKLRVLLFNTLYLLLKM